MRIVFLTQDEPFYLARNMEFLLSNIPDGAEVVGTVLFDAGVGKKKSFIETAQDTYQRFGFRFFAHYGMQFVCNKLFNRMSVKRVLKEHNVPIITLDKSVNSKESLDKIRVFQPDLLISILGNQIFKKDLINLAPKGCLNLHTALLPKYRGLMPTFWVLKNGEKETAASVFFVDEGIDSGEIIVQKRIPIDEGMSQQDLIKKSKMVGMEAIIESIQKILNGGYELIPNDNSQMTYYTMPTRKDVDEFYRNGKKFF